MRRAVMESLITNKLGGPWVTTHHEVPMLNAPMGPLQRRVSRAPARLGKQRKEKVNKTDIARTCHEVNRAYCQALGDMSQPSWEDAPGWQKESALMGVRLHLGGDHGPEASHESWMAQKLAEGWVYGPVKNPEKKEHPCMVPFLELPKEQQAKDFIFRAVVHSLRVSAN